MSKRIVFFLHEVNDVDHISPVIHALSKSENFTIVLVPLFKNLELLQDFRFKFVTQLSGVEVLDLTKYVRKIRIGFLKRMRYFFKSKKKAAKISNQYKVSFDYRKIISLLEEGGKINYFVVDQIPEGHFIFNDIIAPIKSKQPSIETFVFPHSVRNFDNFMVHDSQFELPQVGRDASLPVDKIFYNTKEDIEVSHFQKSLLNRVGSLRFTHDWIDTIGPHIEVEKFFKKKESFKIAFFLGKPTQNYNIEEVFGVIRSLGKINNVEVAVQVHSRVSGANHKVGSYYGGGVTSLESEGVLLTSSMNSWALIEACDLFVFSATSLVSHAIALNKPVLHLRRVQNNRIYAENYFSRWGVDCRDDLINLVTELRDGSKEATYSDEERSRYLEAIGSLDYHQTVEDIYEIFN